QKAAQMIVNNAWAPITHEDGRKKTVQEIADELGLARSTLYEWEAEEDFVAYVNYLTDVQLSAMRSEVNVAIMRAVRGGNNAQPSIKALELYMKRFALLQNVDIVEFGKGDGDEGVNIDALRERIQALKAIQKTD
ncbi:hypothetical protein GNF98_16740, partial [Clostridium perfringens]